DMHGLNAKILKQSLSIHGDHSIIFNQQHSLWGDRHHCAIIITHHSITLTGRTRRVHAPQSQMFATLSRSSSISVWETDWLLARTAFGLSSLSISSRLRRA